MCDQCMAGRELGQQLSNDHAQVPFEVPERPDRSLPPEAEAGVFVSTGSYVRARASLAYIPGSDATVESSGSTDSRGIDPQKSVRLGKDPLCMRPQGSLVSQRRSSDNYQDLMRPEDLGIAFGTRCARVNTDRRGNFLNIKPMMRRMSTGTRDFEGVKAITVIKDMGRRWFVWLVGILRSLTRMQRWLKVSAVLSCIYVLAIFSVVPLCIPESAGSTVRRLTLRKYAVGAFFSLLHAVASLLYSVLTFVFRLPAIKRNRLPGDLTMPEELGLSAWQCPGFWLDLLSCVGLVAEFVHLAQSQNERIPSGVQWTMLLQLGKLWRVLIPEGQIEESDGSFLWGFVNVLLSLAGFAHAMGSVLLFVGGQEVHDERHSWLYSIQGYEEKSCPVIYVEAFYFATLSLTSVGYGDLLVTPLERTVNSFFLLFAQLFTAKVCADLTWLTSTANHWEAMHQAKRAQAWVAMQHMSVPRELAERVMAFQQYRSQIHRDDLEQQAFAGLSANLVEELRLCTYRKLVVRAPFLREQPKHVISFIVGVLQDCISLPADIIVRSGSLGRELFFVSRGEAAVYIDKDTPVWGVSRVVATYLAGNYFGEIGMLTGHPRAAWIMANTYCITSVMPYSAVEDLGAQYPGAFTALVQGMAKTYNLKSTVSWKQVALRLQSRGCFKNVEEAFLWFCTFNAVQEDDLSCTAFEEGMRRMKISPLDRRVLWAAMDEDNSGAVTFDEFASKVTFDDTGAPLRSSRVKDTVKIVLHGSEGQG